MMFLYALTEVRHNEIKSFTFYTPLLNVYIFIELTKIIHLFTGMYKNECNYDKYYLISSAITLVTIRNYKINSETSAWW